MSRAIAYTTHHFASYKLRPVFQSLPLVYSSEFVCSVANFVLYNRIIVGRN